MRSVYLSQTLTESHSISRDTKYPLHPLLSSSLTRSSGLCGQQCFYIIIIDSYFISTCKLKFYLSLRNSGNYKFVTMLVFKVRQISYCLEAGKMCWYWVWVPSVRENHLIALVVEFVCKSLFYLQGKENFEKWVGLGNSIPNFYGIVYFFFKVNHYQLSLPWPTLSILVLVITDVYVSGTTMNNTNEWSRWQIYCNIMNSK